MATALLPKEFLRQVAQCICDGWSSWNVHLNVNSHLPNKDDVPADYTEPSYSTYLPKVWALIDPTLDADDHGTFDAFNARFAAPSVGDGSITVHGWFVTGVYASNIVIMAAQFDSPIVLTHGGGDLVFDLSFVDFDNLNP